MCGIAGIISKEPTTFNVEHFNILGTLNDERGGDSCGVFIDGKVEYGLNKNSLYRKFMTNIQLPDTASIALLHCRKASAGMIVNAAQAQPVVFRNSENKIEYVVMHNGTITNAKELAKRYCPELEVFGLSDTQIVAYIMYHTGYDVLEEYVGTAVFVIVDYRQDEPCVFIFKGSSCYNETGAKSERPLYCSYNDNKFYFSSIYSSLYCINHNATIYEVPVNQLLLVDGTDLIQYAKIDRTKLSKPKVRHTNIYDVDTIVWNPMEHIYLIDDIPAHGEYRAFPSGFTTAFVSSNSDMYYFFRGRLLCNKDCFEFLTNLSRLFKTVDFAADCPEIIDYFAYGCKCETGKYYRVNNDFKYCEIQDFEWTNLFSSTYLRKLDKGFMTLTYIYPLEAAQRFHNYTRNVKFDFDQLEDTIYKILFTLENANLQQNN